MGCILMEFSDFKYRKKMIYPLNSCATHWDEYKIALRKVK